MADVVAGVTGVAVAVMTGVVAVAMAVAVVMAVVAVAPATEGQIFEDVSETPSPGAFASAHNLL